MLVLVVSSCVMIFGRFSVEVSISMVILFGRWYFSLVLVLSSVEMILI